MLEVTVPATQKISAGSLAKQVATTLPLVDKPKRTLLCW